MLLSARLGVRFSRRAAALEGAGNPYAAVSVIAISRLIPQFALHLSRTLSLGPMFRLGREWQTAGTASQDNSPQEFFSSLSILSPSHLTLRRLRSPRLREQCAGMASLCTRKAIEIQS